MLAHLKHLSLVAVLFTASACAFNPLDSLKQTNVLHFAQDLKAEKQEVSPGETINLSLRLPSNLTPYTVIALYEAKHADGPFKKSNLQAKPTGLDSVSFEIPTQKNEAGSRYYQVTMNINPSMSTPYSRSDVERIFISKPKNTYLQIIHFGEKRHDALAPIYMCTGGKRQLNIWGGYEDGVVRPLTAEELGTKYEVVNPPYYRGTVVRRAVVDVSENGFLEAFDAGMATLIVTNGPISNSRDIIVDDCETTYDYNKK